ncbi:hypothetical protein Tco_1487666, partial [Tanacetum coccineum]
MKDPSIRRGAKFGQGSFSHYLGDSVEIGLLGEAYISYKGSWFEFLEMTSKTCLSSWSTYEFLDGNSSI